MFRRAVRLAVALAALGAAGCGSSDDSTQTVVRTVTAPGPAAGTPTTTTETGTETGTGTGTGPPVAGTNEPPSRVRHVAFFRSPSGNIGCVLAGGEARCDIRDRTWSPPAPPVSCRLDFGQGLIVGATGRGRLVCAGDTALNPHAPALAYGTASRVGTVTCTSKTAGMACANRAGHGFFISRESYRLF